MEGSRQEKDKQVLRRIFPELVWMLIFDKVVNCFQLLENCSNSSLFIRQLLASRRPSYLFPKTFALVGPATSTGEKYYTVTESRSLLLKLRIVCRVWCDEISKLASLPKSCIRATLHENNAYKFINHFGSPQDNFSPFIGNSVLIYHMPDDPFNHIKLAVETYGRKVHHCVLHVDRSEEILLEILRNLPNLQKLSLDVLGIFYFNLAQKFPKLENLSHLKLVARPDNVVTAFLQSCPNLTQLYTIIRKPLQVLSSTLLENLQHLALDIDANSNQECGLDDWRQYPVNLPKLTCLELGVKFWPRMDFVQVFGHTLENLSVYFLTTSANPQWEHNSEAVEREEMQFVSCYPNLEESNVWNRLPKLNRLTTAYKKINFMESDIFLQKRDYYRPQ